MSPVITLPTEHGIVLASQVSGLETHLVLRLPALPDSQVDRLPPPSPGPRSPPVEVNVLSCNLESWGVTVLNALGA